ALVQRAQNDFKGPGVMVLPAALRGLGRAQSALAISAQRLPALADALAEVFSVFTGRLTANPKDLAPSLQSRNLRLRELSPELESYEGTGADVISGSSGNPGKRFMPPARSERVAWQPARETASR